MRSAPADLIFNTSIMEIAEKIKIENQEQNILDAMIRENPNIETLINSLDLEIINTKENEYTTNIR